MVAHHPILLRIPVKRQPPRREKIVYHKLLVLLHLCTWEEVAKSKSVRDDLPVKACVVV